MTENQRQAEEVSESLSSPRAERTYSAEEVREAFVAGVSWGRTGNDPDEPETLSEALLRYPEKPPEVKP